MDGQPPDAAGPAPTAGAAQYVIREPQRQMQPERPPGEGNFLVAGVIDNRQTMVADDLLDGRCHGDPFLPLRSSEERRRHGRGFIDAPLHGNLE